MDDPLLIQGLRPRRTGPYAWQRVLRDRLRCRHKDLGRGAQTKAAEDGLGFPRSAYWYVQKSDAAFGRIAVVWRPVGLSPLDALSGALPFDSGGLWRGHIMTRPQLPTRAERLGFVRDASCLPDKMPREFTEWLAAAYPSDPVDYLAGAVPKSHTPRIVLVAGENTPRAWTWELRVAVLAVAPSVLALDEIFWTEDDYEAFELWLHEEDDALSSRERMAMLRTCMSISNFAPRPADALFERLSASFG